MKKHILNFNCFSVRFRNLSSIRNLSHSASFSYGKFLQRQRNCKFLVLTVFAAILISTSLISCRKGDKMQWRKGNMHTHTFWSDGDDFPEPVAKWYKDNGYDFLVFTDHNILLEGERWRKFPENHPTLVKYTSLVGETLVDKRPDAEEGHVQVRLRTLKEFRSSFEEPEKYLLIMGNEITDQHAVHLVAIHQDEIIPTVGGTDKDRATMVKGIVGRVDEYRNRTGRNVYPALAHPNFRWAITAEMMLEAENLRFFEVYNGHPAVNNDGDEFRAGTERIWDIVLANRLYNGRGKLIYGLATDDTHRFNSAGATPGRGWVMVRTATLTPEAILDALDKGDFYSSTGVIIKDVKSNGKRIKVEIEQQQGVEYLTEYIGTFPGFSTASSPTLDADGNEISNTTRTYSQEIGRVLASSNNTRSEYKFTGDELYVRVRITSTADQVDKITGEVIGKQKAWVQPEIIKIK